MVDDAPCNILECEFVKPGKGQAFTRLKIRNLKTGRVVDRTYKANDTFISADVADVDMQYLYNDTNIQKFFSFYNISECITLINVNIETGCIYHAKYGNIKFTLPMLCAINNNKKLFNFLINYMSEHCISTFIKSDITYTKFHYDHFNKYVKDNLLEILENKHEELIFRHSMRYLWIESCIV